MASQGPNYPADITDAGGINPWTNPTNIGAEDGAYATSVPGVVTNQLLALDFGFTIPDGSTINGLLVEFKRGATLNTGGEWVEDYELFMEEDGSFTVNFAEAGHWSTSVAWHSYGGPTNLLGIDDFFGTSYATPGDINLSQWGVSIKVNEAGVSAQALIDAVRITVYYTSGPQTFIAAACTTTVDARCDLAMPAADWHLSADCVGTIFATCGLTVVVAPFFSCETEIPSDVQYETPWESCVITEEPWESCTIYEIPWTSDC